MHPRERVLGLARLHKEKGVPIPLTLAAEAQRWGLELVVIDEQHQKPPSDEQGDSKDGETRVSDLQRSCSISLVE